MTRPAVTGPVTIRVGLPEHLRTLARVSGEVALEIPAGATVTLGAALESQTIAASREKEAEVAQVRSTYDTLVNDMQAEIAQYDTPERILHEPADEFVAEFVGVSSRVPVERMGADVHVLGTRVRVRGSSPPVADLDEDQGTADPPVRPGTVRPRGDGPLL